MQFLSHCRSPRMVVNQPHLAWTTFIMRSGLNYLRSLLGPSHMIAPCIFALVLERRGFSPGENWRDFPPFDSSAPDVGGLGDILSGFASVSRFTLDRSRKSVFSTWKTGEKKKIFKLKITLLYFPCWKFDVTKIFRALIISRVQFYILNLLK